MNRRELTWKACDAIAAEGKKPSLGSVREWTIAHAGAKQGSDGDVQNDVNLWYTDLLQLKQEKQSVPGLPDSIARLARDFWVKANEAASDALTDEREKLATEKREMEKMIDLAQEDTVQAVEIANALKGKLAVANETIAGRSETIKRLEESLSEIRALVQAKDERIEGLTADLARKAQEHTASLTEIDGLRKHTLLQIDQARGESRHWKSEFERVDSENKSTVQTYRQRSSTLGNELAAARARLSAVEEMLENEQARSRALDTALASARERKQTTPVPKRVSVARSHVLGRVVRKKL